VVFLRGGSSRKIATKKASHPPGSNCRLCKSKPTGPYQLKGNESPIEATTKESLPRCHENLRHTRAIEKKTYENSVDACCLGPKTFSTGKKKSHIIKSKQIFGRELTILRRSEIIQEDKHRRRTSSGSDSNDKGKKKRGMVERDFTSD